MRSPVHTISGKRTAQLLLYEVLSYFSKEDGSKWSASISLK
jgi:hypothetical protein